MSSRILQRSTRPQKRAAQGMTREWHHTLAGSDYAAGGKNIILPQFKEFSFYHLQFCNFFGIPRLASILFVLFFIFIHIMFIHLDSC